MAGKEEPRAEEIEYWQRLGELGRRFNLNTVSEEDRNDVLSTFPKSLVEGTEDAEKLEKELNDVLENKLELLLLPRLSGTSMLTGKAEPVIDENKLALSFFGKKYIERKDENRNYEVASMNSE